MNKDTTILIPSLSYFTDIIIKLYHRFDKLLTEDETYKRILFERYAVEWIPVPDEQQEESNEPEVVRPVDIGIIRRLQAEQ